jgi:predicted PhzF superfamily epimerase YddE/YHI9
MTLFIVDVFAQRKYSDNQPAVVIDHDRLPVCDAERMAAALGVEKVDFCATPIQQVAAGTSAMIVPLRSLAALRRCYLNPGCASSAPYRGISSPRLRVLPRDAQN